MTGIAIAGAAAAVGVAANKGYYPSYSPPMAVLGTVSPTSNGAARLRALLLKR